VKLENTPAEELQWGIIQPFKENSLGYQLIAFAV
jgi:hypothetical protein